MSRPSAPRALLATAVGTALLAAACSGPAATDQAAGTTPRLTDPTTMVTAVPVESPSAAPTLSPNVPLFLADINTTDDLGQTLPTGILAGVTGTIPGGSTPQPFRDALRQVDPALTSDAYAAEAYDAVVLAALGAAASKSDAGRDIAATLVALTNGDTECTDYAECLALVQNGTSIAYRGRSGPLHLSANGEPTEAVVGVYRFGADNRLQPDVDYTEVAVDPGTTTPAGKAAVQAGAGDGTLTIGSLLPQSGSLSFMRPAQLAGITLALQDIAAAGGVPGISKIATVDADSGDETATTAAAGLKSLLAKGVDVIVGMGATTTAGGVVPAAAQAGVLYLSPVNASLTPVTNRYDGLYWRMSPSGLAQGALLGTLAAKDGHSRVALIHSDDGYASSLAQQIASAVPQSGGTIVANVDYAPDAKDFAALVAKVKKADPQAIVLVGFGESSQVISELVKQGIGPNSAR